MANLRSVLYAWRENEAAKKGVELFRVLPNSAIDEIVRAMPKTKEELTAIKGIKDAKYNQYGVAILNMVKEGGGVETPKAAFGQEPDTMTAISYITDGMVLPKPKEERMIFSVSTYLDIVNRELSRVRAAVKGEVTSFKAQGKAVYFSIRDAVDGSTLSVFMWMSDFDLAGIALTEGLEVVIEGRSEIYKPSGRFSFRAETIQPVGEGAFKKAYDELKKKMEVEGLFIPERKRKLKEHPVRIGLVTSRSGAVIHDFLSNLGNFGFHVAFVDSRVEGAGSLKDILSALCVLEAKALDALVLIRGGGSLESLQAFNNEHVVRKIAEFPAVTICAIGHDKDVPLVQLVADYAPSTPTATTILHNASWDHTIHELQTLSRGLIVRFEQDVWRMQDALRTVSGELETRLDVLIQPFRLLITSFNDSVLLLARQLSSKKDELHYSSKTLLEQYRQQRRFVLEALASAARSVQQNDPLRQLKLGYSILTHGGKVVRSIADIAVGQSFDARLSDGTLVVETKEKHPINDK